MNLPPNPQRWALFGLGASAIVALLALAYMQPGRTVVASLVDYVRGAEATPEPTAEDHPLIPDLQDELPELPPVKENPFQAKPDPFSADAKTGISQPEQTVQLPNGKTVVQNPFKELEDLPPGATKCDKIVRAAMTARGKPYSQGGYLSGDPVDGGGRFLPRNGPDSFDCSGMVWWAYQNAGEDPGWVVSQQAQKGQETGCQLADLNGEKITCWQPGDLIILNYPGGHEGDHVALYVGDGQFMDCLNHAVGCILHRVESDASYQQYFWKGVRFLKDCSSKGSVDELLDMPTPQPDTSKPTLQPGQQSSDVRELQKLLNEWIKTVPGIRLEPLEVNGIFDARTKEMVQVFKKTVGLPVDGTVTPEVWGWLKSIREANNDTDKGEATPSVVATSQPALSLTSTSDDPGLPVTTAPQPVTATPQPVIATPQAPTAAPQPATATPLPPTATPLPPTATPLPATATPPEIVMPQAPTATPLPEIVMPPPPTVTPQPEIVVPPPPTATPPTGDSDGDTVPDDIEIAAGSDPFDAASTPEVCDGLDNDLDGVADDGFPDTDSDGLADCVDPVASPVASPPAESPPAEPAP